MKTRARARIHTLIARLEKQSSRIAWARFALFVTAVALLVYSHFILAALPAAAFVYLVGAHGRVRGFRRQLESRLKLSDRQKAASELDWNGLPELPLIEHEHELPPYLFELDVLGERSLLRLFNYTISSQGFDRLLQLFRSNDVSEEEILRRQALVQEIRSLKVRRTAFLILTGGTHQIDSRKISALVGESFLNARADMALLVVWAAQILFVGSGAVFFFQGGRPYFLVAGVLLYLAHAWGKRQIHSPEAYSRGVSLSLSLERFGVATQVLERTSGTRMPALRALLGPFSGERSASRALARLDRVVGALGVRQNFLAHLLVHLVFPWDFLWTRRLEKMRVQLQKELPVWSAAVAEFEALASLAQFADANPEYVRTELLQSGPTKLVCSDARHPLLPRGRTVGNDLELTDEQRCILITGSNMSGKSTFLRTIGTNLLLAKAGSPVAASRFQFANLPLHSALRVGDSIQEGLSSFLAEVRRLKEILDAATAGTPVLFLIDEILRGTNNRERLVGSRSYIRALTQTRSYGLVTTHDLELATLESTHPAIANYHFKESIHEGLMSFSYRKEKGPSPSTNALEVMRINGLPIDP